MTDPKTMGAYLRFARRKRRISIERAAEQTRIRPDFLMRMESDEFDFLAPAYVRGFLKTYARFLRVDPGPLLEEFDHRYGGRIDTSQIVALERHGRRNSPPRRKLAGSWTVAAAVAAAFLMILGVVGLVAGDDEEVPRPQWSGRERPLHRRCWPSTMASSSRSWRRRIVGPWSPPTVASRRCKRSSRDAP